MMDFERLTPKDLPAKGGGNVVAGGTHHPTNFLVKGIKMLEFVFVETLWLILLVVGRGVVFLINSFLDWWAPNYQEKVNLLGKSKIGGNVATDGVSPPGKDVKISMFHGRYGPHEKETYDELLAEDRTLAGKNPAMVYIHGGGFIAANSASLLHSIAPIVRHGYDVYSLDYPLAPSVRFPDPIVSILRAFEYIKKHEKKNEILVLGDSAGASLMFMACALVCNKNLLEEFSLEMKLPIHEWDFPEIIAMTSIYGIMDQKSWKGNLDTISWFENKVTQFCVEFALRLFRCQLNRFKNRFTILDIVHDVEYLPPVQIHCGNKDILVQSNRELRIHLEERGVFEFEYHEYNTRHCYFGFPPAWLSDDSWHNGSKKTLERMITFCDLHSSKHRSKNATVG